MLFLLVLLVDPRFITNEGFFIQRVWLFQHTFWKLWTIST